MASDNNKSASQSPAPTGSVRETTPMNHPKGGARQISMMAMAIMIVTTIVSMRGLASQAEFGFTSIF